MWGCPWPSTGDLFLICVDIHHQTTNQSPCRPQDFLTSAHSTRSYYRNPSLPIRPPWGRPQSIFLTIFDPVVTLGCPQLWLLNFCAIHFSFGCTVVEGQRVMIGIIVRENVDNSVQPLKYNWHYYYFAHYHQLDEHIYKELYVSCITHLFPRHYDFDLLPVTVCTRYFAEAPTNPTDPIV